MCQCGTYDEEGMIRMPPLARLAQESLTADGVFLLENGQQMYLWLGRAVSTQLLHDLFNVTTPVEYLNSAEVTCIHIIAQLTCVTAAVDSSNQLRACTAGVQHSRLDQKAATNISRAADSESRRSVGAALLRIVSGGQAAGHHELCRFPLSRTQTDSNQALLKTLYTL